MVPFIEQYVTQAYLKSIEEGQVRTFDDFSFVVCFLDVRFISSWVGR